MNSAIEPASAAPTLDPDLPPEVELTHAVRGKEARRLITQIMRYRQALRAIRDMPDVESRPVEVARAMQDRARVALIGR